MAFSSRVNEVDYILVSEKSLNSNEAAYRQSFETGLENKGLRVDHEEIEDKIFTKLSLSDDTKYKYFEILEFRMPLKMEGRNACCLRQQSGKIPYHTGEMKILNMIQKFLLVDRIQNVLKRLKNYYLHEDDDLDEIEQNQYFAPFKYKQHDIFDLGSSYAKKKIWNILITKYILSRQKCVGDNRNEVRTGIEELIEHEIFTSAFPLHDGTCDEEGTKRTEQYKLWNKLYFWENIPRLDGIRDYLGNTCAVYFVWLEFYTQMLFPASVLGILLLLYGLITLSTDEYSNGVCKAKNVTMCPICDYEENCNPYELSANCAYTKVAHLLDNDFTIVYSTLMALWTSVLGGLWIRRNKVLQRKWNLLESIDEKSRIGYIKQLNDYRHFIGRNVDKIPLGIRLTASALSGCIILFFIVLVAIAIISIMMYEIWITTVVYSTNTWMLSYAPFIIPFTSSLLNLFTINILNSVYSKVAEYLNNVEVHRTRSEYDRALTIKKFAFQFINTYASIFYIALIKEKFNGIPGKYVKIFGHRQSECNYGGCLMELSIQLATIMIGQQIIESFMKIITTYFRSRLKRSAGLFSKEARENSPLLKNGQTNNSGNPSQTVHITSSRWEEDNKLLDFEEEGGLFNEYLELAIQYGFVILFTPAFPLAPLFAWIRNIFEIRFDATKILLFYRRLVPHLNPNMSIWVEIFNFMGNISVLINAIVIAFSTNVITRLIFSSTTNGHVGYFNSTLSLYQTSNSSKNATVCYYSDFREPYWSPRKYERTDLYWEILVAKFIFIILYQNIILLLKNLILKWISETPGRLYKFQKEERDYILSSLEVVDHTDVEGSQYPVPSIRNTTIK